MSHIKVAKSNQVLKEVIQNSWNGIGIIDINSKFIYVNQAFKPLLGFHESELIGMNLIDLLQIRYKEPFKNLVQKNLENQYTNSIRVQCVRKDKELVYLDISIKFMSNKKFIVINVNDITQNVSDHEIFDKYVIQAHVDTNGIINKASEAFCRLSFFSSEELIGQHYSMLNHSSLNEKDLETRIWRDISVKDQFNGIIASKNRYGDIFWVDVILSSIKNKYGDITGYSAVMFDVTHEISLQKNTEVLEKTIDENESKLKIMGETLRTVAHQWRQPLNHISLEAQDLLFSYQFSENEVQKDEAISTLESMRDNIDALSSVISQFQLITELKSVKLRTSIKDISNNAFSKSIILRDLVKIQLLEDIVFNTYHKELETAIVAILDNAYEAVLNLDEDNEKIIIYKTYLSQNKKSINIEISNNGGTINNAIMSKMFDAYYSTKDRKNGFGLSLYISKIIVELHLNGKIEVLNKKNNFVTFTIILPIGIEDDNNTSKIK